MGWLAGVRVIWVAGFGTGAWVVGAGVGRLIGTAAAGPGVGVAVGLAGGVVCPARRSRDS